MNQSDKGPKVYELINADIDIYLPYGFTKMIKLEDHDSALTKANLENLVLREEIEDSKFQAEKYRQSLEMSNKLHMAQREKIQQLEIDLKAQTEFKKLTRIELETQKELNRKLAEKLASANALILFNANKASDGAVMNHAHKLEAYRKEHTCNTTLPCKACESLTQQSQKGQGDGKDTSSL